MTFDITTVVECLKGCLYAFIAFAPVMGLLIIASHYDEKRIERNSLLKAKMDKENIKQFMIDYNKKHNIDSTKPSV